MADPAEHPDQVRERLTDALRDVLDSKEEFHIENAPDGSDGYMQCTQGKPGCLYIEYSTCPRNGTRRMYRCTTDVPFETAVGLFETYAAGKDTWIKRVEWEEWTDEFHEKSKPIGFWKLIGYGLVGIYLLIELYFRWPIFLGLIVIFAISYYCSIKFKHKFFQIPE